MSGQPFTVLDQPPKRRGACRHQVRGSCRIAAVSLKQFEMFSGNRWRRA
jgi:hypothetical protein